jgi:flagellin-like protein
MKGISPLVASVLLIAITLAIAAILANWVTGIVAEEQQAMLVTCPFGSTLNYQSAEYPKWDAGNSQIVAVISGNVPLGDFKFSVILTNDTALALDDRLNSQLTPGTPTDIRTNTLTLAKSNIKSVEVLTNCTNVKTEARSLK